MSSSEEVPSEIERERSRVWRALLALALQVVILAIIFYVVHTYEKRSDWRVLLMLSGFLIAMMVSVRHSHNLARQHITSTYDTVLRTIGTSKPRTRERT